MTNQAHKLIYQDIVCESAEQNYVIHHFYNNEPVNDAYEEVGEIIVRYQFTEKHENGRFTMGTKPVSLHKLIQCWMDSGKTSEYEKQEDNDVLS